MLLVDHPSKIAADADDVAEAQETAVDGLLQLMSQAKTDLLIVSPYFVPGDVMMGQFAELRRRGVRVRVLTNSLASNDAPAAHVGYARYREALLAMGIELYEMRAEQEGTLRSFGSGVGSTGGSKSGSRASLHAKVVVMDGRLLVVGSMNLDLRSKLQNSEVAIIIRNRTLSQEATRMIEPALASGAYHVRTGRWTTDVARAARLGTQGFDHRARCQRDPEAAAQAVRTVCARRDALTHGVRQRWLIGVLGLTVNVKLAVAHFASSTLS